MTNCYECSAPFTPTPPLRDQVCSACGECPCTWCRDCGTYHTADELEAERCEECRESNARVAARERRDAIEEGRGDYLRDEGKDWRAW
jgi:hypothetical protein